MGGGQDVFADRQNLPELDVGGGQGFSRRRRRSWTGNGKPTEAATYKGTDQDARQARERRAEATRCARGGSGPPVGQEPAPPSARTHDGRRAENRCTSPLYGARRVQRERRFPPSPPLGRLPRWAAASGSSSAARGRCLFKHRRMDVRRFRADICAVAAKRGVCGAARRAFPSMDALVLARRVVDGDLARHGTSAWAADGRKSRGGFQWNGKAHAPPRSTPARYARRAFSESVCEWMKETRASGGGLRSRRVKQAMRRIGDRAQRRKRPPKPFAALSPCMHEQALNVRWPCRELLGPDPVDPAASTFFPYPINPVDSLTQATLGAAVGEAVLGRKVGGQGGALGRGPSARLPGPGTSLAKPRSSPKWRRWRSTAALRTRSCSPS